MVGDRAAALAQIDRAIVHELLARATRPPRTLIVGPVPRRDAQALFADPEMLMEPVALHRCCRDQADGLVILAQNLVGPAILPRCRAERLGPGVGVALAFDADEHRGRLVLVRLGIASGLVLADPDIEPVVGHLRLDAAIAGRTAIIERQLRVTMSGTKLVRRMASPRIGSGSTSSFGLKKSSAPENRSVKLCGQLKMNCGLSRRFITFGADVPQSSSAGELAALMNRWNAFSGIANSDPFCQSKVCRRVCPSCQTSVVPRPSTTRQTFS